MLLPEELTRSNPHCLRNKVASLNSEKKLVHSNILHHLQRALLWIVYKATLDLHKYFKANFNIIFLSTLGSFLHTQPKSGMYFPFSILCHKSHLSLP